MPFGISSSTSFTVFLGGVKTSLSLAPSCILFTLTSSHPFSLVSSKRLVRDGTHVLPFPWTQCGQASFQFPCLSLYCSYFLYLCTQSRPSTYIPLGMFFLAYCESSAAIGVPVRAQKCFPPTLQTNPIIDSSLSSHVHSWCHSPLLLSFLPNSILSSSILSHFLFHTPSLHELSFCFQPLHSCHDPSAMLA